MNLLKTYLKCIFYSLPVILCSCGILGGGSGSDSDNDISLNPATSEPIPIKGSEDDTVVIESEPRKEDKPRKVITVDKPIRMQINKPEGGEIIAGGKELLVKWITETEREAIKYDVKISWENGEQTLKSDIPTTEAYVKLPVITTQAAKIRVIAKDGNNEIYDVPTKPFSILSKVQDFKIIGPAIVNKVPFEIDIKYPEQSFLAKIRIYTRSSNNQWSLYDEIASKETYFDISLPDGTYDFYFAGEDIVGNKIQAPTAETDPHYHLIIDTKDPELTFISPQKDEVIEPGSDYKIKFNLKESNVEKIEFYYSLIPNGTDWQLFAKVDDPAALVIWDVPKDISNKCSLRIVCFDKAGNQSEFTGPPFSINYSGKIIDVLTSGKFSKVPIKLNYKLIRNFQFDSIALFYSTDLIGWNQYNVFKANEEIFFTPAQFGKYHIYLSPIVKNSILGPLPNEFKGNFNIVEYLPFEPSKYELKLDLGTVARGDDSINLTLNGQLEGISYITIRLIGESIAHDLGNFKPANNYKITLPKINISKCRFQLILKKEGREEKIESSIFELDSSPPLFSSIELVN